MGAAIAFLFSSGQRLIAVVRAQSSLRQTDQERVDAFHRWYYDNADRTWDNTRWLGVLVQKNPFDLWIYQELVIETHPDVLIEAGTFKGGSAYFFASIFDFLGQGRVHDRHQGLPQPTKAPTYQLPSRVFNVRKRCSEDQERDSTGGASDGIAGLQPQQSPCPERIEDLLGHRHGG
jgi:hypothetical protein